MVNEPPLSLELTDAFLAEKGFLLRVPLKLALTSQRRKRAPRAYGKRRPRPRQCFSNSHTSPLDDAKLHSVGMAALPGAPRNVFARNVFESQRASANGPPIERFASFVEGGASGRDSAFRKSRKRRIASHRHAAGATKMPQRSSLSPAALAGRRKLSSVLRSGCATRENCNSVVSHKMEALAHLMF